MNAHCAIKRGSLLGNEELDLGGDLPIFEIIYPNLEQRSIFAKKSTHFSVIIKISLKWGVKKSKIGESPPKSSSSFPNRDPLLKPSQNVGTLIDFAFSLKFNKKFISSFGPYFKAQKLKIIVKLAKVAGSHVYQESK